MPEIFTRTQHAQAKSLAGMIGRNVDLWYTDRITFQRFGQRQRRVWSIAERLGLADLVTEIVRPPLRTLTPKEGPAK